MRVKWKWPIDCSAGSTSPCRPPWPKSSKLEAVSIQSVMLRVKWAGQMCHHHLWHLAEMRSLPRVRNLRRVVGGEFPQIWKTYWLRINSEAIISAQVETSTLRQRVANTVRSLQQTGSNLKALTLCKFRRKTLSSRWIRSRGQQGMHLLI